MREKKKNVVSGGRQENANSSTALLIGIIWFGLFIVHAGKSLEFFPLVIPDEYWYTSDLRHRSFSEVALPGYLYYGIYSVTSLLGQRFFDAGRVLNALFFVLSAPFLYGVARTVCEKKTALFIAFFVLVSPISSYTAYFMPESMYFTAFWAFAWLILCRFPPFSFKSGMVAGAMIAVMSLIKMHGLFLLPGYMLFALGMAPRSSARAFAKTAGPVLAGMAVSFLLLRLGIGFAVAGANGLNPLGTAYGEFAREGAVFPDRMLVLEYALYNLIGHVSAICVLFGLPVAMAASCLSRLWKESDALGALAPLGCVALFAFCLLLPLIGASCGFAGVFYATYSSVDIAETEAINARYYNFIFPFFPIIVAGTLALLGGREEKLCRCARFLLGFSLVAGIYAVATAFYGYQFFGIPAYPEMGGMMRSRLLFWIGVSLLAILAALAWARPTLAGKMYLYGVLPAIFIIATVLVHIESIHAFGIYPEIYDKGGLFARERLGEQCADLTVVDSFVTNMTKALIHIDNAQTDMLPQFAAEVDVGQVKPGKKWLLVFGGLKVPERYVESQIVVDDESLTPELWDLMRSKNDFRHMPRYVLVKLKR